MEFYLVQSGHRVVNLSRGSLQTFTFKVKAPFAHASGEANLWEQFVQATNDKFGGTEHWLTMTVNPPNKKGTSNRSKISVKRRIILEGNILTELHKFLNGADQKEPLKIELRGLARKPPSPNRLINHPYFSEIFCSGFSPKVKKDGVVTHNIYVESSVTIPAVEVNEWKFEILIKVPTNDFFLLHQLLPKTGEVNRQFFEERKLSDFTILSEDGTPISCHKVFLAQSPVLLAMLEGDFQEANRNEMDMSDMTTEGVNALLEYLYCNDVHKAVGNCDIALELLKAADKYNLPILWASVSRIFREKVHSWFDVNMALELFDFACKCTQEGSLELKGKTLQVLALKPDQLSKSVLFKELFPSFVARDMITMALKTNRP